MIALQAMQSFLALNGTFGNRASGPAVNASTRARSKGRRVDLADDGAAREGRAECGGELLLLSSVETEVGGLCEGEGGAKADGVRGGEGGRVGARGEGGRVNGVVGVDLALVAACAKEGGVDFGDVDGVEVAAAELANVQFLEEG